MTDRNHPDSLSPDNERPSQWSPLRLGIFQSRLEAICDEMGAVLSRAALSPNIKERLDFSCAVFDRQGGLVAQAAHIPVHLGSMAFAMTDLVEAVEWAPGDMVVVNDPYLGGTHLPDVTLIAPVFTGETCRGFVVNRAHHADIGASSPGSMPLSRNLEEEGIVLPPTHLLRRGQLQQDVLQPFSEEARADFSAQMSANRAGVSRLQALLKQLGSDFETAVAALNRYGERLALAQLAQLPAGEYRFEDVLDSDGLGAYALPIRLRLVLGPNQLLADFTGTADQVAGNVNCPLSVAAAAVFYVFRCLLPPQAPSCAGSFRPLRLVAPDGCLINARRPAAVAAGNVETSTRLVDVVLGALAQALPGRVPAASHGSMNNLAMGARGARPWNYYETMGGGAGAGAEGAGASGIQTHMTNTRNTPVESLEMHYPLRVRRYALRRGSGGEGLHAGGDGLEREFEFLAPASVTLLTERRYSAPWGLAGAGAGRPGKNHLNGQPLPDKAAIEVRAGDRLRLASAGGGGWGTKPD